jgi:hypothetical protein
MRRLFLPLFLFASTVLIAAETKPSAADYELRGFFGAGVNTDISLQNTRTGKSAWYHLGDRLGGILVEKADYKTGTATIVVNGERRTLRLAGESVMESESEKEKLQRRLLHSKILEEYFARWEPKMRQVRRESEELAGVALFKSHPEYFTAEGSHTPEAKAAILRIMKEGIMAGMAVPKKDGTLMSPPKNLDVAIESIFGDITITLNPPDSNEEDESPGSRTTLVEINGHPRKSIHHSSDGIPVGDARRAKSTIENVPYLLVPLYRIDLQNQDALSK